MRSGGWTAVLPVKRLTAGKSRLRGAVPGIAHADLALALAADTATATLACPEVSRVLVVTDDPAVRTLLTELGAEVEPDTPDAGLNAATAYGAGLAEPDSPVCALAGDLPALRPEHLAAALRAAASAPGRHFVPDVAGTGTTMLAAPAGVPLDPRFGAGSAAAHAASGARSLAGTGWPTLRRDVDTPADLAAARRLGLGPHTTVLLHHADDGSGTVLDMQGTVATYDPLTRSGSLLLDDGTPVDFEAAAFDASGLRMLRLGQRLRIERDEAGRVRRLAFPT